MSLSTKTQKNISGHARLRKSLVLRDYLAYDLKLDLELTIRRLRDEENRAGAEVAFTEGRYLDDVFRFSATADLPRLEQLDLKVRDACQTAHFIPRYFQYLALLLTAHHLECLITDHFQHLDDLNRFHATWSSNHTDTAVEPFNSDDLQRCAFWMATAAGKTHILHACLALLAHHRFDRILLITPTEQLSRQHGEALRRHASQQVFVYPQDGDASQIGYLLPDTVVVIDINKLTDTKQGEGISLDAGVFRESRNLVLVDEGHKGQKSEGSVWKRIQQNVAGIGHEQERYRGMLIEFSATFGQVAEAEHAFDQYAKSVIFDYAYDRFHADLYGKDFQVLNLKGGDTNQHEEVLSASLLTYWSQLRAFKENYTSVLEAGLKIEVPLWVLLGLSVVGSTKTNEDKQQTTDVIEVIRFLNRIFSGTGQSYLKKQIEHLASDTGKAFLPEHAWHALQDKDSSIVAGQLLKDVFGHESGAMFSIRHLKKSPGEMGIALLKGDTAHYFGVINVGDASGLASQLIPHGIEVGQDAFTDSLFVALEDGSSGINLLIGSRRFSEGWNNYRASTMTLLRLGSGEGPLIIQMFGRVVRFKGTGNMKRLATPGKLAPLQTAYVYGLRADYMQKFLEGLTANGVDTSFKKIPTRIVPGSSLSSLLCIQTNEPECAQFSLAAVGGSQWYAHTGCVTLSLHTGVQKATLQDGRLQATIATTASTVEEHFKNHIVPLLNFDSIMNRILEFRAAQGWWNLTFDLAGIREGLLHGRYRLEGMDHQLELNSNEDLWRLHLVAVNLLQRMIRSAYRRQEAKLTRYLVPPLSPDGDLLLRELEVRTAS